EEIIATAKDPAIDPILTEWSNYLNFLGSNAADYQPSGLWDYTEDIAVDLDVYHIAVETGFFEQPPHVLNVQQIDSNTYIVKTMFNITKDGQPALHSIYNVIAHYADDEVIFSNFLHHYTANWSTTQHGAITYVHSPHHYFDAQN